MAKFMDLFDNEERDKAVKVLDFYEGKSEKYLKKFLEQYRPNALRRGMRPRTRNLTRQVIEKSGMLFAGRPPVIEVWDKGGELNPIATEKAIKAFEDANWIEVFNNFDALVRMMKSAIILPQIDPIDKKFVFTVLSQHNAAAHFDGAGRIDTLIYFVGRDSDGNEVYALITPEFYQTVTVREGGYETISDTQPNPYGFVNCAMFHDTNLPMKTGWNSIPLDLCTMNEMYNVHITDTDYAGAWTKLPTLFTNAEIDGDTGDGTWVPQSKLGPRVYEANAAAGSLPGHSFAGGPGQAVQIDANGQPVYLEYKSPNPDLKSFDEVMKGWVRDFAGDWSVQIEEGADGYGSADSGFKLMVKEIPNMELRKKRQRFMEAGFKRLYEVMLKMAEKAGIDLVQNTELFIVFPPPELPIDEQSTEQTWTMRIKEKRATVIDYFIVQLGLSREEAEAKVIQMAKDQAFIAKAYSVAGVTPIIDTPATTNVTI